MQSMSGLAPVQHRPTVIPHGLAAAMSAAPRASCSLLMSVWCGATETSFQSFGPGSGGPPTSHIYPQPLGAWEALHSAQLSRVSLADALVAAHTHTRTHTDPEDDDEPAAADHSPATVPIAPGFPAVVVVDEEEPSVLEPESRGELDAPLFDTRTAGSVASAMFSGSLARVSPSGA